MKHLPLVTGAVAMAAALGTKLHYSAASAAELEWILAPTVWLVSTATGLPFFREAGVGYTNHALNYSIAPVCAGVNFFIVAFLSIVFAIVRTETRPLAALGTLAASAAAAYVATLLANTLRLAIALELRANDIHFADGASAHRMLGILVYVPALFLVFELAQRRSPRHA